MSLFSIFSHVGECTKSPDILDLNGPADIFVDILNWSTRSQLIKPVWPLSSKILSDVLECSSLCPVPISLVIYSSLPHVCLATKQTNPIPIWQPLGAIDWWNLSWAGQGSRSVAKYKYKDKHNDKDKDKDKGNQLVKPILGRPGSRPQDILGIFWWYHRDILGIYCGYIGDILRIYRGYLGYILVIYWGYIGETYPEQAGSKAPGASHPRTSPASSTCSPSSRVESTCPPSTQPANSIQVAQTCQFISQPLSFSFISPTCLLHLHLFSYFWFPPQSINFNISKPCIWVGSKV